MDSKNYVLSHDYGYGRENQIEINRLELRNIEDLIIYVDEILENQIIGEYIDQTKVIDKITMKISYEKINY